MTCAFLIRKNRKAGEKMATIENALQVGNMLPALRSVNNGLAAVSSGFQQVQRVAAQAFSPAIVEMARQEVVNIEVNLQQVHNSFTMINNDQRQVQENYVQINNAQQQMAAGTAENANAMAQLQSSFAGVKAMVGKVFDLQRVVAMSDELARTKNRLQMLAGEGQNVNQMMDQIYGAAQRSRTPYIELANTVADLGNGTQGVFKNTDETIAFTEQLNKQFQVASLSQEEIAAATSQVTQAMTNGAMSGQDFAGALQNAPGILQAVADYMGQPVEKVRELAEQGQVSANVMKNAMLAAAAETDAALASTPMTWASVWTEVMNTITKVSQPVLALINGLANNWSFLRPIVMGVAAAFGAYAIALGLFNAQKKIAVFLEALQAARTAAAAMAQGTATVATWAQAAAQNGLNAALLACPLTWILLAIIAIVVVIYLVIAAINEVTGSTYSATGMIVGAIFVMAAIIWNAIVGLVNGLIQLLWSAFVEPWIGIIEFILNAALGGFDSFGGFVANLIGQIISWFLSLGKVVTKIIDAIFGTNWTAGLSSLQDKVLAWGKTENSITLSREAPELLQRVEYGAAYDKGYGYGSGIKDKLSFQPEDFPGMNEDAISQIAANTGSRLANTAAMGDSLGASTEDMSYMRDLAEQEAINRFTTAEIKVEMNNQNQISSGMDIDGIVGQLEMKVYETMTVAAEGSHL